MTGGRIWTAREDEVVKSFPIADAIKLLRRRRTAMAVRSRRSKCGLPPTEIHRAWTFHEDEVVRSHPIAAAVELLKNSRTRAWSIMSNPIKGC